jgi:hypothetical protein
MTRDEARRLEQQRRDRYPEGTVEVTRVPGGAQVKAGDERGIVFVRADDGSPLLAMLAATPRPNTGTHPGPA